jgi:hypothetical protein
MFPRIINEENAYDIFHVITKEELHAIISSFKKYKSLRLDGWSEKIYEELFKIIEDDLLRVVEEFHTTGKLLPNINSSFIAVIPKKDQLFSFQDFEPIVLCNNLYKIIVVRIKPLLFEVITPKQFGFLNG